MIEYNYMNKEVWTPEQKLFNEAHGRALEENSIRDLLADRIAKLDLLKNEIANNQAIIDIYSNAIGKLIGRATYESEPEISEEVKTSLDVYTTLTPELQKKADSWIDAMSWRYGVKKEAFNVLRTGEAEGQEHIVVAYSARNGLYRGSWNDIFSKNFDLNYIVEVDGQKLDTRMGMTFSVYKALIADARSRSIHNLPDSYYSSGEDCQPWTSTLLTGEAALVDAPITFLDDGLINRDREPRYNRNQNVRFRPAVVIK